MTLPKARVILIDKPQTYNNRHDTRRDNPRKKTKFGIGVAERYSKGVMSDSSLDKLGEYIRLIAAPDAYIFSWMTIPNLTSTEVRLLGRTGAPGSWGVEYKTCITHWLKTYPNGGGFFKGAGSYGFPNLESLAIARFPNTKMWHDSSSKSKPDPVYVCPHPRYPTNIDSPEWKSEFPAVGNHKIHLADIESLNDCFHCTHAGKIVHSRKPDIFHMALDAWLDPELTGFSKVELFATKQFRSPSKNSQPWICLGYDVTGSDIFDDIKALAERMGN